MNSTFPSPETIVDLTQLPKTTGINLHRAFARLKTLYDEVDEQINRHTSSLDLPCHRGCSSCCEDAVFLTPLEFYALWHYCQETLSDDVRGAIVRRAQAIYRVEKRIIEKMDNPLEEGQDHTTTARTLRFSCPVLDDSGACQAYNFRELAARLFGASFNAQQGIYGCKDVGDHLGGRKITLIQAEPTSRRLSSLPLTQSSQVLPAYLVQLFGEGNPEKLDAFVQKESGRKKKFLHVLDE